MSAGTERLFRAPKTWAWRGKAAFALLMALGVSGCVTDQKPSPMAASAAAAASGPTLAFESIDGPPAAVFGRLIQQLEAEATARQIAVVSREAPAQYRLRGYLAVKIEKRRPAIVWAWDVYAPDQTRVVRVSGEDAGVPGRNDWSAADEPAIARIASATLRDVMAALSKAPATGAEPPVPSRREINMAAIGDPRPDARER